MIRYALKCPEGHQFESWFQNAAAFDTLVAAGHLACPNCGATQIEKGLMTPDVRLAHAPKPQAREEAQLAPQSEQEKALAALKAKVEAESDYVGLEFAREARAMHEGEAPERSIYGEAKPDEAIALIEDGVPVAPLPFTPSRKVN